MKSSDRLRYRPYNSESSNTFVSKNVLSMMQFKMIGLKIRIFILSCAFLFANTLAIFIEFMIASG